MIVSVKLVPRKCVNTEPCHIGTSGNPKEVEAT
jgi:hypothetical protein